MLNRSFFIYQITTRSTSTTRQNAENNPSAYSVEDNDDLESTLSHCSSQSTGTFKSATSMNTGQSLTLEEVFVSPSEIMDNQQSINRGEIRKSKSKMRTYLKKCKDAIIGQNQQVEDIRPISTQETNSCTSWYLDSEETKEISEEIFGVQSINFNESVYSESDAAEPKISTAYETPTSEVHISDTFLYLLRTNYIKLKKQKCPIKVLIN